MWNLKPEWWGSLLVQEKYQAEKACEKRQPYNDDDDDDDDDDDNNNNNNNKVQLSCHSVGVILTLVQKNK